MYKNRSSLERMTFVIFGGGGRQGFIERVLDAHGVAAIIATAITITICWLAINNAQAPKAAIPDILSNALTTILGFYFGTAVGKQKPRERGVESVPNHPPPQPPTLPGQV